MSLKAKLEQHKFGITFCVLIILGFAFRMYPHIFLIPMWVTEESFIFKQTQDLTRNAIFNITIPILTQLVVIGISRITQIDLRTVAMSFNPLISALTVVPLYYLASKYLSEKQSLIVCLLWTFVESVFYRSSIYSSTEPLAIFLCIASLGFYVRGKYVQASAFLGLSFLSHLLPGAYTVGVVSLDMFLSANRKTKVVAVIICVAFALFLMSPFNTHIKQQDKINPIYLFSRFKLSNFMIYSLSDIMFGMSIFMGSIVLVLLSALEISIERLKIEKLVLSMLIVAFGLFSFSWIFYSPYLFAPPRLTIYFVVPLAILSSKFISMMSKHGRQLMLVILPIIMIISTFSGLNTFLTISDAPTTNEYIAINDLYARHMITDYDKWFADYPATCSIVSSETTNSFLGIRPANQTLVDKEANALYDLIHVLEDRALKNTTSTMGIVIPARYNYIFVSERMTKSAFFNVYTGSRAYQAHFSLTWAESSDWILIYDKFGIQVYERSIM